MGGGVYLSDLEGVTIEDVMFFGNLADKNAGGMYGIDIKDVNVSNITI